MTQNVQAKPYDQTLDLERLETLLQSLEEKIGRLGVTEEAIRGERNELAGEWASLNAEQETLAEHRRRTEILGVLSLAAMGLGVVLAGLGIIALTGPTSRPSPERNRRPRAAGSQRSSTGPGAGYRRIIETTAPPTAHGGNGRRREEPTAHLRSRR